MATNEDTKPTATSSSKPASGTETAESTEATQRETTAPLGRAGAQERLEEPTTTEQSGASAVREVAQQQPDRVAIVSRTAMGEPDQSDGYDVIGVPEGADEKAVAAAENRPEGKA